MSGKDYVYKKITGIALTIDDRHTAGGKYLVTVRVKDDSDRIWTCNLWDEDGNEFIKKGLLNQRVYYEGVVKEESTISVKFFHADAGKKGAQPPSRPKQVTEDDRKEYLQYLEQQGRCIAPTVDDNGVTRYRVYSKKDCIKVNGKWESKMEYCLRIMGPSEVMSWLREFRDDGKPGGVFVNPKVFKEKMATMIEAVQRYTGDFVEFYEEGKTDEKERVEKAPAHAGESDICGELVEVEGLD